MNVTPAIARVVRRAGRQADPTAWAGLWLLLSLLAGGVMASAGSHAWHYWQLLALAPLVEEIVFRLGLHESLLRQGLSRRWANLLVALVFGVMHAVLMGNWAGLLRTFPALGIGLAYGSWRRLAPCVAIHAAMNAFGLGVWGG